MGKFFFSLFLVSCVHLNAFIAEGNVPGFGSSMLSNALFIPIEAQLRAFREGDIEQAYSETLSKEFKEAVSLEDFVIYVKKYPILFKHTEVEIKKPEISGEKIVLRVILNPDQEAVPVDYTLSNEDGRWKIWNMSITQSYWGAAEKLIKDLSTMRKPVENQLKSIRNHEVEKAYYDNVSKAFQEKTSVDNFRKIVENFPILSQYTSMEFNEPMFSKGTGELQVVLKGPRGSAIIEYTLGIENDQWKIWSVKIVKQSGLPKESSPKSPDIIPPSIPVEPPLENSKGKEEASSEAPVSAPLDFVKMDIGTRVTPQGEIANPSNVLEIVQEEIHVRLFIAHGTKGTKVEVLLEHLENQSGVPAISTTLQQDGDAVLTFVFLPPSAGWPLGHFEITATASTGAKKVFPFTIK